MLSGAIAMIPTTAKTAKIAMIAAIENHGIHGARGNLGNPFTYFFLTAGFCGSAACNVKIPAAAAFLKSVSTISGVTLP